MSSLATLVNHQEVVDYIIGTVQSESVLNGFQLEIYHDDLKSIFGKLTSDDLFNIYVLLGQREEVNDVIFTKECFDVVLGTYYAPNYGLGNWE